MVVYMDLRGTVLNLSLPQKTDRSSRLGLQTWRRVPAVGLKCNVRALIIRIGSGCILYYNNTKNSPK